jgi:hypothetical protein
MGRWLPPAISPPGLQTTCRHVPQECRDAPVPLRWPAVTHSRPPVAPPARPPVPRPSIARPGRPQASHRAAWQPQEPPSCAPRSVRRIVPAGTSRNGPPPANLSIAAIVIRCADLSIVISASARAGWNISYRKQRRKVREPVREHVPSNTRPQLNARRSVHRSGISKRPHTLQVLPHRRTLVLLTQGICGRFRSNRL